MEEFVELGENILWDKKSGLVTKWSGDSDGKSYVKEDNYFLASIKPRDDGKKLDDEHPMIYGIDGLENFSFFALLPLVFVKEDDGEEWSHPMTFTKNFWGVDESIEFLRWERVIVDKDDGEELMEVIEDSVLV